MHEVGGAIVGERGWKKIKTAHLFDFSEVRVQKGHP